MDGLRNRFGERNSKMILMGLMGSRHRPLRGRRIKGEDPKSTEAAMEWYARSKTSDLRLLSVILV